MEEDMESDRPYLANYAIGFLVVIAMLQSFQALVFYCYSYVVDESDINAISYAGILVWFVVSGSVLAFLLLCSSKLGYLLCIPLMLLRAFMCGSALGSTGFEMDLTMVFCFSVAVLILLLTPPVRRYYLGKCGLMPDFKGFRQAE